MTNEINSNDIVRTKKVTSEIRFNVDISKECKEVGYDPYSHHHDLSFDGIIKISKPFIVIKFTKIEHE